MFRKKRRCPIKSKSQHSGHGRRTTANSDSDSRPYKQLRIDEDYDPDSSNYKQLRIDEDFDPDSSSCKQLRIDESAKYFMPRINLYKGRSSQDVENRESKTDGRVEQHDNIPDNPKSNDNLESDYSFGSFQIVADKISTTPNQYDPYHSKPSSHSEDNMLLDNYGNDYFFKGPKKEITNGTRSDLQGNDYVEYRGPKSCLLSNPSVSRLPYNSRNYPDVNLENGEIQSWSYGYLQEEEPYHPYSIYTISDEPDINMNDFEGISRNSEINDYNYEIHEEVHPEDEGNGYYGQEYNDHEFPTFPQCWGTPKRIRNIQEPKITNFSTPKGAWQRVFEKYSPTTEILHSPVKHLEANLIPNVATDNQLYGQVWILGMSEQFYYDNAIILLQKYNDNPDELKYALMMNFQSIDSYSISETMVDLNILGSGTFGDVFRARKAETQEYFAIKYLKNAPKNSFYEHTDSLLEYLKEKNYLIRARNSPFVVQFYYSAKFANVNGLFLFFEWCICDLRKYVNLVSVSSFHEITNSLWDGDEDAIDHVLIGVYGNFKDDLFSATLVYIFEVFCAIDFLAKCNIVHQDLKPENIMIATNLHLKIGDFGLVYNTKFITRSSQIHLVDVNNINYIESTNYKPRFGGTATYEDMEQLFRTIYKQSTITARRIMDNKDRIDHALPTNPRDADPNFLSDLWSCGIIATELIFGGVHFLYPAYIPNKVRWEMSISNDFKQAVLEITYMKSNYRRYIEKGFVKYGGEDYIELMEFLASIFKPRAVRAVNYVDEKEIYRFKHKVKLKHINIKKVERIALFEAMGLSDTNVFLFNLPKGLAKLLGKRFVPEYRDMNHLISNIIRDSDSNFFNIEPGIQSSYY